MTAAHEQRISDRRRLRLQSLCEVRRQKMPKRRQEQFNAMLPIIYNEEHSRVNVWGVSNGFATADISADWQAYEWKRQCQSVGIGMIFIPFIGQVANVLFWRFFMPILIQLAKDWLEEMAAESSQVTISGVAMGSAEGGT